MDPAVYSAADIMPECLSELLPAFGEKSADEAYMLIAEIAGVSVLKVRIDPGKVMLSSADKKQTISACSRRAGREPVQYITGRAFFMHDEFIVGPGVLIPRGDTERLVEKAVEIWRSASGEKRSGGDKTFRFIDFCTGSGCVAISLVRSVLKEGGDISGLATDISREALVFADENISRLGVSGYLHTVRHDFLSDDHTALDKSGQGFDLIIMNPPYIRHEVIEGLDPEVRFFEPLIALDGGYDGLDFYRAAARTADRLLRPGGYFAAEIGFDQESGVCSIFRDAGGFSGIRVEKDHGGNPRVFSARKD